MAELLKEIRSLQSIGLMLLGLTGVIAALAGLVQVFLLGYPLTCGSVLFPQNQCEEVVDVTANVVETIEWNQRQQVEEVDKRIAHSDQVDFCFLTRVTGKFEGSGELVEVVRKEDGWWHLRGSSHQAGVGGSATCIKLDLLKKDLPPS